MIAPDQCPACLLTHGRHLRCRIAQRIAESITRPPAGPAVTMAQGPEDATGWREVEAAKAMAAGYRAGAAVLAVHAGDTAAGRVPMCSTLALAPPAGTGKQARKAWGVVLDYLRPQPAGGR